MYMNWWRKHKWYIEFNQPQKYLNIIVNRFSYINNITKIGEYPAPPYN